MPDVERDQVVVDRRVPTSQAPDAELQVPDGLQLLKCDTILELNFDGRKLFL